MTAVTPIRMPKWGLSMQEGTIVDWHKQEGDQIAVGDELVDIETSKITNVCESPGAGVLRRIIARDGETLAVGALIGVLAEAAVDDAEIAAFIDAFQANFTPATESDEDGSGLQISTVDVGGRTIRVGRLGQGAHTPVVLIHGYAGDLNNWLFNVPALAALGPVILIDLPGHGGSSKAVGDGSLKSLADAVSGALEALEVEAAHLVGHSLGAAVVARMAADRPARAASLTLIAPAYMPGTRVSDAFLNGVIEAGRARDLRPVLEQLVADPALISKDMVEDMLKFKRLDGAEEALGLIRGRMLAGEDEASLQADLARTPAALVIASRADQIVGAPEEAALPSGYKVVWIDNAGHMPHLEQAQAVNALILEAISRP
jgi:pyruvate dehydrogenase E2 component (dihydrolipoamide acetyltransferase)